MGTMVAEYSFHLNTYFSRTIELVMDAQPVLAKVCLSSVEIPAGGIPPNGGLSFGVFIHRIKRKKPDGNIEEVSLSSNVVYDDNMTSIMLTVSKAHVAKGTRPTLVWALVTFEYWRE